MSNLRFLGSNAIETATLTASSTAGTDFNVANLATSLKADIWRGNSTTERLSATWSAPEPLNYVALPVCNASSTGTLRARVTTETAATNLLATPNDFTAASWTKANVTAASGVAGPDGSGTSATTLTASAANAEIYQSLATTSGAHYTSSIFIRRRTGTGVVSIRNTANTAWTPLTLTSAWSRAVNDGGVAGTTAAVDILIATSGDAIDVAFAQMEAGTAATSYYPGTRPTGYIDAWQSYAYDSGAVACAGVVPALRGFTPAQAASAYAYGGGNWAELYLPSTLQATGLALDISDPSNLQGYIEAAFFVAGAYWEPKKNADYGASAQPLDRTKNDYSAAGDLLRTLGTRSKKLSFTLSKMDMDDRATLWDLLQSNGTGYPIMLSIFPQSADAHLERTHRVWGTLVETPSMTLPSFNIAAATLSIQSL